jgi:3',5'-cyclic AMP phosphodiesterase CpdA
LPPVDRDFAACLLSIISSLLVLTGCASTLPQVPPPVDSPGHFVALTRPIIALGDTQEHESAGFPMHDNDGAVDGYIEVAQRPPEAPLFSRRILEWVIDSHPADPIIHLGDVLDMSCRSELRRMTKLAVSLKQPGAVLPGNHDGLLFGIFNYDIRDVMEDSGGSRWERACRKPSRDGDIRKELVGRGDAITKRDYILAYLALLASKHPPAANLLLQSGDGPQSLSWRNPDPTGFFEAIEARIAQEDLYSSSFVAQKLSLPAASGASRRVKLIGLDTNQVLTVVGVIQTLRRTSPGDIGGVNDDQIEAISPWVEEAVRAGDIVIFAGHHDWAHLSLASQARLAALMSRLDHPLVYLSAHTHRGFWATHQLGLRPLLELNVSSLSDWPLAYRRIAFEFDAASNRLKVVADILPKSATSPTSDAELLHAWTEGTCVRSGLPVSALSHEELDAVRKQKASRGSLWEWMLAGFGVHCEGCMQILFEDAHRYQDQLLGTIVQIERDLGEETLGFRSIPLPPFCAEKVLAGCIADLRGRTYGSLEESVVLFRRKNLIVDLVNDHLDEIQEPRAKAYMACRAVLGAKIDFDETAEADTPGRSEAFRKAGDFFRIEATVGVR